jgi:hypothetical protein
MSDARQIVKSLVEAVMNEGSYEDWENKRNKDSVYNYKRGDKVIAGGKPATFNQVRSSGQGNLVAHVTHDDGTEKTYQGHEIKKA